MPNHRFESKPPPKCKAVLLCDEVCFDQATKKLDIKGVRWGFTVPTLPAQTPPFTVFVQLVGGIGRYRIVGEIHDLQTGRPLFASEGFDADFPDRICLESFPICWPGFPVRHHGDYDFVLFADGQEIDRLKFSVVKDGREEAVEFVPAAE
ncbi:MAG: hypothetical protein K2R98_16780 [Gemmataceae bacterium]|nr:hypothetical protein [Gemmataceae bacterium]